MNMNEIETLILTGVDDRTVGMKYAQGFGRLQAFLWGTIQRMSPEDQADTRKRLEEFAQYWSAKAEKVEESTT
jgi:hypothetical protein